MALADAIAALMARGVLQENPLCDQVTAISVGLLGDEALLDLDYTEDSGCDTDMNVVMTGAGGFVEIQGTAEGEPFAEDQLQAMLGLARKINKCVISPKLILRDH